MNVLEVIQLFFQDLNLVMSLLTYINYLARVLTSSALLSNEPKILPLDTSLADERDLDDPILVVLSNSTSFLRSNN